MQRGKYGHQRKKKGLLGDAQTAYSASEFN